MGSGLLRPAALKPGDKIALLSPSSPVKGEYIDAAAGVLAAAGYVPVEMPGARGPVCGTYAAADQQRLADILEALRNPEIRAIFCTRGGYGANHLLAKIDPAEIAADPKWLVGFSDISALHALWQKAGVISIHGPMAKHLAECGADHYCSASLLSLLKGERPDHRVAAHPLNRKGSARGILRGGNLAVFNGLASTPFDPLVYDDSILFIEDVSEQIYAVERMLIRLRLSGAFDRLKGLVCGHFTQYRPNANHTDMEEMIAEVTAGYEFPLALGFPAGHTDDNLPLLLGADTELHIDEREVCLISK